MTKTENLKLTTFVAPSSPSVVSTRTRTPLGDTGYRANPDAFAAQMAVFGRMRDTEYAFRQRARRGADCDHYSVSVSNRITAPLRGETGLASRHVMQNQFEPVSREYLRLIC